MRWDDVNLQSCSIARSAAIFGDRWTLLILREIFMRIRRFSDLQKTLGITKHRLSDRLNRLLEAGILYKELYDEAHKRFEYKLTEKGLELYPILIAIVQWGDKWESDDDGVPMEYIHKDCGKLALPKLCCTECDGEIHARNTVAKPGPGVMNKISRNEDTGLNIALYAKKMMKGS